MKATQSTDPVPCANRDSAATPHEALPDRFPGISVSARMVALSGLAGFVFSLSAAAEDRPQVMGAAPCGDGTAERSSPAGPDEHGARSMTEVFFLHDKAASQGRQEAYWPLAAAYFHGRGVTVDYGRASEWLERAAQVEAEFDVDRDGVTDADQAAALLSELQERNATTVLAGIGRSSQSGGPGR